MTQFDKEGILSIKNKQFVVGDLVDSLTYVSGSYFADFLQNIGLNLPRKMRMNVLKQVLRNSVEQTIEERKSLADEMGYRLTWFLRFTDTQLVNLLEWYKSVSLSKMYLEEFWTTALEYFVLKGVAENELEKLFGYAAEVQKSGKRAETKEFNNALNVVLFDDKNEIDGVTQDAFRPVLYKSSTLTELRSIGDKYNAPIPKRLRKNEVLEIIIKKLTERNELTPALEEKLKNQNIILLERFAKDNDIKVSTELKKEEIIEFILSNAKETKSIYYAPSSSAVYEEQPGEFLVEEKVEEVVPVQEVVQEEVLVEEVVVEEPKVEEKVVVEEPKEVRTVQYSTQAIDYRPQLDKLASAFEVLVNAYAQKELNKHTEVKENEEVKTVTYEKEVPVSLFNKSEIIKEMLNSDELEHQVEEKNEDSNYIVDENGELQKVDKTTRMSRFPLGMASFFSFVGFVLALVFAIIALPQVNQLSLITPYINFIDLASMDPYLLVGIGGALALINFIAGFVFISKKLTRTVTFIFSLITLVTSPILAGVFGFIALLTKVETTEEVVEETDQVGRIVNAINGLNGKVGNKKETKKKSNPVLKFFTILFFIAFILILVIFAIWRLDFTQNYDSIEFIGPWLRDSIIIPIFRTKHYLA